MAKLTKACLSGEQSCQNQCRVQPSDLRFRIPAALGDTGGVRLLASQGPKTVRSYIHKQAQAEWTLMIENNLVGLRLDRDFLRMDQGRLTIDCRGRNLSCQELQARPCCLAFPLQ